MKNDLKITGIFAISADGIMKRGWQMGPDDPPLITLPQCKKYLQETIGLGISIIDYNTFYELRESKGLPKGGIIIFGKTQEEWQKYYAKEGKEDASMVCCPTVHQLESLLSAETSQVFLLSRDRSVVEQFRPILHSVHILSVDQILEGSKDFYALPKFRREVWMQTEQTVLAVAEKESIETGFLLLERSPKWVEEVADLQQYMDFLWEIPVTERDEKKVSCFMKLQLCNGVQLIALAQKILGKKFLEVYKAYDDSIPVEYQEYATYPTPKLSGLGQQQKIFCEITSCWLAMAFNQESLSCKEFDNVVDYVYNEQSPADMLHGDTRKDLDRSEIGSIVKATLGALGVRVNEKVLS